MGQKLAEGSVHLDRDIAYCATRRQIPMKLSAPADGAFELACTLFDTRGQAIGVFTKKVIIAFSDEAAIQEIFAKAEANMKVIERRMEERVAARALERDAGSAGLGQLRGVR